MGRLVGTASNVWRLHPPALKLLAKPLAWTIIQLMVVLVLGIGLGLLFGRLIFPILFG